MSKADRDGEAAFPPVHDPNTHEFGLTKIEYAAIHLRVPESGTDWLDEMIRESLRTDPRK